MADAKTTVGTANGNDYAEHEGTYSGFIRVSIAGVIACVMVLVSLIAMTVIGGGAFWVGAIGLIVGLISLAVALVAGMSWTVSLLIVAAMVILSLPSL